MWSVWCLKASLALVQLRQTPHSVTYLLHALPNRYQRSSLCPLTLLIACAAIAVAYRYEWYQSTTALQIMTYIQTWKHLTAALTISWLRVSRRNSPCSDSLLPTFCSQQWPVAHGVEWYGGWWTMNLKSCGLSGSGVSAVLLSDWGKPRRTSAKVAGRCPNHS
jgi:hypothetical protein